MNIVLTIISTALIWTVCFYLLLKVWPRSGKMGVNLKEIKCPKCGAIFPKIRKPQNISQALWGGWTCQNCGCETDKYGNEKKT